MPTKKLTELFAARVKPPAKGRVEFFDATFGGWVLRVTESGHKSWSLYYRLGGRLRRYTIGLFPAINPAQARREAGAALERARQGVDLTAEKRRQRDELPPEADTFAAALSDYLDRARRNMAPSTFAERKRTLEREFKPWRTRPIASITRGDVNRVADRILARGAEIQANRALAYIRRVFNWSVERGRLPSSPVAGMKLPSKERTRDRVLSDDEIRWLWLACDEAGWPFGPLARVLLLTAQRRDEVATMERREFDLKKRTWTIPREKTKNDRAHEVQLSTLAVKALKAAPEIGDRYVFTTTGETPISGFSRGKRRLDAEMVKARRRQLHLPEEDKEYRKAIALKAGEPLPVEIPRWTLHDLRRTAATGMARLNFPPHVVDKVLNHVTGTIRGVAAIYNRFEYLNERHAALEAWGAYIQDILCPAKSNVILLNGKSSDDR